MRVKKLNNNIRKNGFDYKLIERTESKAIYAQQDHGYEVFKIKSGNPHPLAVDDLANYDKIERFPGDEDFGKSAWTYKTLPEAQKRYAMI
jgi:hypothetical protein